MDKKSKILIVDDEKHLREALSIGLSEAGFEVMTAENGPEGLAQALKDHPDLILLDITMPKMSGHHVLHELRKDSWGKTAKVAMLTALDDAANVSQGVAEKADNYIMKTNESIEDIIKKAKQTIAGYV